MTQDRAYRQIFKAMSIFGGVQILVVFFGIIRNKVVAVSMGPSGVGEIGLYTAAITLMIALTSFGIGSSGVKLISEAYHQRNIEEFNKSVFVFNKLSSYSAMLGSILTFAFSPLLSKWSFGSYDHTLSFMLLSLAVQFIVLDTKHLVLLQSVMNLKDQGKASVFGALIGTVISLPLYFLLKERAIIPSLLVLFLSNMLFSYLYARRVMVEIPTLKYNELKQRSKSFISLGFAMTISYILVMAVSYIVRLYISQEGGVQQVGLYQAGWAIVNGYVGLIFTAMAKDYFPRLSSVNQDNSRVSEMANQQMELGMLIISPIIIVFLISMDRIVALLYSSAFYSIKDMMIWSLLGMFFKLLSWSISYIFLAKGLSGRFVIYEVTINVLTVLLNVTFYKYVGLEGLGIAFCLVNLIYLIIVFYMARRSFEFSFNEGVKVIFLVNFVVCAALSFLIRFENQIKTPVLYISFSMACILVFLLSIKGLNKRLKFFGS